MIEQMDYPVVEMLLEETIRCLTSLPAALKQNDFTPVLQAIEAVRARRTHRTHTIARACAFFGFFVGGMVG